MAIKSILVAFNGAASSKAALQAGLLMARKYDAHLTGLLAHGPSRVDSALPNWAPKSLRDSLSEMAAQASRDIATAFHETLRGRLPEAHVHWIDERGRPDATVAEYSRLYDIAVIGRQDGAAGAEHLELRPARVALKSGRPVLVTPANWSSEMFSERAVLAWDGHRASSRALADAMLILETKQLVTVLTVETGDVRKPLAGIRVETHLERHGVPVERVRIKPEGRRTSEAILDYCREVGAALLVAGAYEHSQFREDLVGGVTTDLVNGADLPVLVSH